MIELGYVERFDYKELGQRKQQVTPMVGNVALSGGTVGGESQDTEDLVTSCGDYQ